MSFTRPPAAQRRGAQVKAAVQLAALRTRFGVLERVAPSAGAAKALDLWCTLPDNAGRRRDLRPGPGEVVRLPVPRGGTVVAECWGDGPTVYLVHGWGGWRGQLGAFIAPLVAAGHRVVAVDAPGHGESDVGVMGPRRGNLMELIEAFEATADEFGPARGVVAHSLGCTAASVVVSTSLPTERLVLVGPNDDFVALTRDFARMLGFGERIRGRLQQAMEDFCERPIADFDLAPLGAGGTMPPTLVVHDRRDKESPYRVGQQLAAAWPHTSLLSTDGLGHQRILADPETVARVTDYLAHANDATRTD